MSSLRGQAALVTGGARRVGKAIAVALAERGADIIVHHSSGSDEAGRTASELRALGVQVAVLQADLTDVAAAMSLPERAATPPSTRALARSCVSGPLTRR